MPDNQKELIKKSIRDEIGWAYPDMLWFSEEEAQEANRQRNDLLEGLSGWINYSFQGSKPHSGPLSPVCLICGNGGWGCNFINQLCTKACFYCPQDRSIQEEREAETDELVFRNPAEHILFLKTFNIRGVGFSGGEPLLVLDRLLAHIIAIRNEFGNSLYLWMYTNGDLVNHSILKELREAGLDEIRFDLSARKYDLAPVRLAKEFIPTVTVEIPAIPEDLGLLKGLLLEMQALGVDFLNLHQLTVSKHNYKAIRQRQYHVLHQPRIPVFESELCALELLGFAKGHQLSLPINYCCVSYKVRFQGRDIRTRQARLAITGFEEITKAGYIRSFRVMDSTEKIEKMVRCLESANCPADMWQCNDRRTKLDLHGDLLPWVDWSSAEVTLTYLEPKIGLKNADAGMIEGNLEPMKSVVYQKDDCSKIMIECWGKLYREKINAEEVFRYLFQNYPLAEKDDIYKLRREMQELGELSAWEELENGLPEVF